MYIKSPGTCHRGLFLCSLQWPTGPSSPLQLSRSINSPKSRQRELSYIVLLQNYLAISLYKYLFFLKKILFIYSWETERGAQRHRQREKQAPCREPYVGLDPGSPGSHPGPKVALNHWATWAALFINIWISLSNSTEYHFRSFVKILMGRLGPFKKFSFPIYKHEIVLFLCLSIIFIVFFIKIIFTFSTSLPLFLKAFYFDLF